MTWRRIRYRYKRLRDTDDARAHCAAAKWYAEYIREAAEPVRTGKRGRPSNFPRDHRVWQAMSELVDMPAYTVEESLAALAEALGMEEDAVRAAYRRGADF